VPAFEPIPSPILETLQTPLQSLKPLQKPDTPSCGVLLSGKEGLHPVNCRTTFLQNLRPHLEIRKQQSRADGTVLHWWHDDWNDAVLAVFTFPQIEYKKETAILTTTHGGLCNERNFRVNTINNNNIGHRVVVVSETRYLSASEKLEHAKGYFMHDSTCLFQTFTMKHEEP
jgi:hypothetical protein